MVFSSECVFFLCQLFIGYGSAAGEYHDDALYWRSLQVSMRCESVYEFPMHAVSWETTVRAFEYQNHYSINDATREQILCALSMEGRQVHDSVAHAIKYGIPLMVGSLGNTEYSQLEKWFVARRGAAPYKISEEMGYLAGVVPLIRPVIQKWAQLYLAAARKVDIFVHPQEMASDSGARRLYGLIYSEGGRVVHHGAAMLPWLYSSPYSQYFKNKIVLVVSPISRLIRMQYELNRTCIYPRSTVLPEFTLRTLPVPLPPSPNSINLFDQTQWPVNNSFVARLLRLRRQVEEVSYDVLVIGAGALSLPVGASEKARGKVVLAFPTAVIATLFGIYPRNYEAHSSCWLNMKTTAAYWGTAPPYLDPV